MLHRLVTTERLTEGPQGFQVDNSVRWTHPAACCTAAVGLVIIVLVLRDIFDSEARDVRRHFAADKAGSSALELPCVRADGEAAPPAQDFVHLRECQVTAEDGVNARFKGFEDVLAPEADVDSYAWTILKVQHLTYRRRRASRGTWEDVVVDGPLEEDAKIASKVRLGSYRLDSDTIGDLPTEPLPLQPPGWQKRGESPPISQPTFGEWTLNSSTMSYAEDCKCLWAGDTRIFIYAAAATVSYAGAVSSASASDSGGSFIESDGGDVGGGDFKLVPWVDTTGTNISLFAPGTASVDTMLGEYLQGKDSSMWFHLAGDWFLESIGIFMLFWPIMAAFTLAACAALTLKRCALEACFGEFVGDCLFLASSTSFFNNNEGRICWTCCRASWLGAAFVAIAVLTGWVGYRYSVAGAVAIGVTAFAIECYLDVQALSGHREYAHEQLQELSAGSQAPGSARQYSRSQP